MHHNGQFDYLDDEVKDMDPAIVIPQYFAQLSEALVVIEADVFAHLTMVFGYLVYPLLNLNNMKRSFTDSRSSN